MDLKYVIVSGGVLSGLGKGVTASSIGVLLKSAGLRVTSIKIDPYLNSDAGTMSPFEHGEVFVLDDGGEVDLDLGNYERFLDLNLARDNNLTTLMSLTGLLTVAKKRLTFALLSSVAQLAISKAHPISKHFANSSSVSAENT